MVNKWESDKIKQTDTERTGNTMVEWMLIIAYLSFFLSLSQIIFRQQERIALFLPEHQIHANYFLFTHTK